MIERLLLSLLLITAAFVAYQLFVQRHRSRVEAGPAGEPRLLYFRSSQCPPCVTQARYLEQLPSQVRDRVAIQKIDADRESDAAARYGVFTLPTTLLLDREGSIRHINYGLTDARKLARQLESIL